MIKFVLGIVVGVILGAISVLIIWEEERRKTKNREQ